jgi:hypothetical protein
MKFFFRAPFDGDIGRTTEFLRLLLKEFSVLLVVELNVNMK